jgi:Flagellar Assembly Protein A
LTETIWEVAVAEPQININYVPELRAVRAEFTAAQCLLAPDPPTAILDRARAKLEAERKFENVTVYAIHWERFRRVWRRIHATPNLPADTRFVITIAMGYPHLPGLTITPSQNPDSNHVAKLTITASKADIEKWRPEWLELAVQKEISASPTKSVINAGSIHAAYFRALEGHTITDWPITTAPQNSAETLNPYTILPSSNKKEIFIVIHDIQFLRYRANIEKLFEQTRLRAQQLKTGANSFRLLKSHLATRFAAAIQGPERLALELPMIVLAAYEIEAKHAPASPVGVIGSTAVRLHVSQDRLQAVIEEVDGEILRKLSADKIVELVRSELARQGIVYGISDDALARVKIAADKKQSPKGILIASGTGPARAKSPELVAIPGTDTQATNTDESQEVRAMRKLEGNRAAVEPNQLIARIIFREAGREGKDVFGQKIPLFI